MYLDFYHLKKAPFHITPDPEFLFLSPSHKTALGALVYGIEERQGFVTLVGEVGLGKTTILRSYLERVDESQLKPIYIFNSNMSFSDLLKTLCREFDIEVLTEEVADTVNRLHQVLIEEYKQGRNVVLIVDEAQHMPIETLEHLRMLSNLETSTQKLIQIVLVGQPEFDDKLNNYALRQLKQRLVIRGTILPLTDEESRDYITYRLAKVVMVDEPIFTKGALREIIKHAKGTPRVINVLCTNALIQGFGYHKRRIATKIVKEVIADYTGKKPQRLWRPRIAVAGITALLGVLFWFSPYREVALSTINLAKVKQFMTPSVASRMSPPQETTAAVPDSLLPASISTPEPPPKLAVSPSSPETSEPAPAVPTHVPTVPAPAVPTTARTVPAPTVPTMVRTVKKGDQVARVALEVYGSANSAVLDWIRKNNPQLRDLNLVDVGTQLTLPPLPAGIR